MNPDTNPIDDSDNESEVGDSESQPGTAGGDIDATSVFASEQQAAQGYHSRNPRQIGPYRIVREIGEGGMGSVYEAEQLQPVKRTVALKVIKAGRDSKQVIARFEAERQALALMEHAAIARILDAGETELGQPYFAMELVKGVPLTKYCDDKCLNINDRLKLFCQICDGIQHAHQKGIIHRDLKPGNILVTEVDGKPFPKIIDFGLAKALNTAEKLTDKTVQTEIGQVLGTIRYMSPEQAGLNELDVDTRSDIYTLGIILYELLTGSTPLESSSIQRKAMHKVLELVRVEEAPRPSSKISTNRQRISTITSQRQIDSKRLSSILTGELDWIVLKSLEKDRDRRYVSVGDFASDIHRFLNDDPISARPPSKTYRLIKFIRKNRGLVAGSSLLLFTLVTGLVGTSIGFYRAIRAEGDAEQKRVLAVQQRERAEQRELDAIAAVKRFSESIASNWELKNNPKFSTLRERLLREPLAFLKKLSNELEVDAESSLGSLERLANVAFDLGDLTDEIGDKEDAIVAFRNAYTTYKEIEKQNPGQQNIRHRLAGIQNRLARLLIDTGKHDEGLELHDESVKIMAELMEKDPENLEYQSRMSLIKSSASRFSEIFGKRRESLRLMKEALAIQEKLATRKPDAIDYQLDVSDTLNFIGLHLMESIKFDPALDAFDRSLKIRQSVAAKHPGRQNVMLRLADIYGNRGILLRKMKKVGAALESYDKALQIRKDLVSKHPGNTLYQARLSASYQTKGNLLQDNGNAEKGMDFIQKAIVIERKLIEENPTVVESRLGLSKTFMALSLTQRKLGKLSDARDSLKEALTLQIELAEETQAASYIGFIPYTYNTMSEINYEMGDFVGVHDSIQEAVKWQARVLKLDRRNLWLNELLKPNLRFLLLRWSKQNKQELIEAVRNSLSLLEKSDLRYEEIDKQLKEAGNDFSGFSIEKKIEAATRLYQLQRFNSAVKLFGQVFEVDDKVIKRPFSSSALIAAGCAILAGANQSIDDEEMDKREWIVWRIRGLEWLKQQIGFIESAAESKDKHSEIQSALVNWLANSDFYPVRGESLEKLPVEEQQQWKDLWSRVNKIAEQVNYDPSQVNQEFDDPHR